MTAMSSTTGMPTLSSGEVERVLSAGVATRVGDGEVHPMQAAFARHDAFQCGYCTPGQIMSAVCLIAEGRANSEEDIREFMSGNICRCGAYPNIPAAIREVTAEG
ncbi:(2Fe-2S)-binding protein [Streptomyces dysideae]|uniref:(2Fe-2S)-binding protein n=1 Tax=Streptomyces dysideae TaxID=909626 RepID=UPI00099F0B91